MKNVFLFGAGASYASNGTNFQPPLGNQLFLILKKKFPSTWGQLPNAISSEFADNFERGMNIIWRQYSQVTGAFMKDLAIFFSKFGILRIKENLYGKIIETIKEKELLKDTVFATLNYDCLLEIASSLLGVKVSYCGPDDLNSSIIVKLHGSCNFVPKDIQATLGVSYTSGVSFNSELAPIQPEDVEAWCYSNNSLYPSMAIYTKDKPLQIGAPAIQSFQKYWQEETIKADKIFIIGVRPNLEDKHIWNCLTRTKSNIYFCGSQDDFKDWQLDVERNDVFLGEHFENTINDILNLLE